MRPSQVNQQFIHYVNSPVKKKKQICLCNNSKKFDCNKKESVPIVPEQHVTMNLLFNPSAKHMYTYKKDGDCNKC